MNLRTRVLALAVGTALLAGACGGGGSGDGPLVVVTTTVLGDVVGEVTGEAATVEVLLPVGADPHDFEASARQVARLEEADLVVAVGLQLEEGLEDVLDAIEADGTRVLRIGPLVEPLWLGDSVVLDSHVWMDPIRMAIAAELVATELSVIDPTGPWEGNAVTYRGRLESLDAEIRTMFQEIRPDRRLLVTQHDSLGYFADRYQFEVAGVVIGGGSTMAQPSSSELAALVDVIEARRIPAIFGETTEPSALLEAIAAEPRLDIEVVELFIGSLGDPGTEADSYIGMLRTDARLIAEALG